MSSKKPAKSNKAVVPPSFSGSAYIFQTIFTAIGIGAAYAAEMYGFEETLRAFFKLDGSVRSLGLSLAIAALVGQYMLVPALDKLFAARSQFNVGHPIHHIAPGEQGISESDRILFLCKLRAFEQILEFLPVFVSHTVAGALLGHHGLVVFSSILYFIGKITYSLGYGTGNPGSRILGLFISETAGLSVLRGAIILDLYRHYF